MRARTDAERKADERERMRDQGFVLRQFWVHPKDWPRVQVYLKRVLRERSKNGEFDRWCYKHHHWLNDAPPQRTVLDELLDSAKEQG